MVDLKKAKIVCDSELGKHLKSYRAAAACRNEGLTASPFAAAPISTLALQPRNSRIHNFSEWQHPSLYQSQPSPDFMRFRCGYIFVPRGRNVCPLRDLSPLVWLRQPLALVMERGGVFFCMSSLPWSARAFTLSNPWPPGRLSCVRTLNFIGGLFRGKIRLPLLIGDRPKCGSDCVDHPSRGHYPGGEVRYWRIESGSFRLLQPTDIFDSSGGSSPS